MASRSCTWVRTSVLAATLGLAWTGGVRAQGSFVDDRWCCQAEQEIHGNGINRHLGSKLATGGDWDGDGRQDVLALGGLGNYAGDSTAITSSAFIMRNDGGTLARILEIAGVEIGWKSAPAASGEVSMQKRTGSITFVGDLDGDERDDIAIGSPFWSWSYADPEESGAVYILLSGLRQEGGPMADVHAEADIVLVGEAGWRFGFSIEGGADVDGDGFNELIIGAPGSIDDASWDPLTGQKGRVCMYDGSRLSRVARGLRRGGQMIVDACTTADVILEGETGGDRFGYLVRSMGELDLESGRCDQFLVGAIEAREQSGAFGFEMRGTGYAKLYEWQGALAGVVERHRFEEAGAGSFHVNLFGSAAVAVPDLNGDAVPEIVIGAPKCGDDRLPAAGAIYVFDGQSPSTLLGGPLQPDPAVDGLGGNSHFGWSLGSLGDFNPEIDEMPDIAVGAPGHDLELSLGSPRARNGGVTTGGLAAGQIFAISGVLPPPGGWLDTLGRYKGDDAPGSSRRDPKPRLGWSLVALDLNGDGLKDVVGGAMGASLAHPWQPGTYVSEAGKLAVFVHPRLIP